MRFSFLQGFNQSLNQMLRIQSATFDTQNQISTGRRVMTPADDPVASARILQINQEQSLLGQFIANTGSVENRLNLEETQVQAVTSMLARVRELTIQAGGLSMTQTDRQNIAAELETRLDELLDLANTRASNGEYIFSGFQGGVKPFEITPTGEYIYLGDDGQREVPPQRVFQLAIAVNVFL